MENFSLISNELLENIYFSLHEINDFKIIITKIFKFLKENSYSDNEIKIGILNFIESRINYFKFKYNLTFHQIFVIVESIINPNIQQSININPQIHIHFFRYNQLINSLPSTLQTEPQTEPQTEQHTEPQTEPQITQQTDANINNEITEILDDNNTNDEITNLEINEDDINYQSNLEIQTDDDDDINISQTEPQIQLNFPHILNSSIQYIFNIPLDNNLNYDYIDPLHSGITQDGAFINLLTANLLGSTFLNSIFNQNLLPYPMNDVKNIMNPEELSKLKIENYTDIIKEKYKECSICLEDYNDSDKLRILKCEHAFHVDCIDKWLLECNYKCPVCRDDSNVHHSEIN